MYRDVTYSTGVGRASIAAGPVFLIATALCALSAVPRAIPIEPLAAAAPLLAVPAAAVGAILSLLPNLLGAALLARLGTTNVGLRLPAAWALIGGLLAGGMAAGAEAGSVMVAAFSGTGATCALLCRSGTRWPA